MFSRTFFLAIVCSGFLRDVVAAQVKLPKGFVRCKRKNPDFEKCVTSAMQLAIPELEKGQPRFSIPPIDPIRIPTLYIDKGKGAVVAKMNFTNMDIAGMKSTVMQNVKVDFRKTNIKFSFRTKQPIVINGLYTIAGKIMVLPIVGEGRCNFKMDNFTVDGTLQFAPQQKNNEQYWHLEKVLYNFNTTRVHINFSNLFKGNKELSDNMNRFMNENWEVLLEELRFILIDAFSSIFVEYGRPIFDLVPITQIFPPQ